MARCHEVHHGRNGGVLDRAVYVEQKQPAIVRSSFRRCNHRLSEAVQGGIGGAGRGGGGVQNENAFKKKRDRFFLYRTSTPRCQRALFLPQLLPFFAKPRDDNDSSLPHVEWAEILSAYFTNSKTAPGSTGLSTKIIPPPPLSPAGGPQ